jgi:hypothetical protein
MRTIPLAVTLECEPAYASQDELQIYLPPEWAFLPRPLTTENN